jgi:hypothetical protein
MHILYDTELEILFNKKKWYKNYWMSYFLWSRTFFCEKLLKKELRQMSKAHRF